MDESLLEQEHPSSARRVVQQEEEEELLWNELKDSPRHGPRSHDHRHAASDAVPLPALRAHIHLPAISTLFRDVKAALPGARRFAGGSGNGANAQVASVRLSPVPDAQGRIGNLDAFLISLYNYYYHKGFWCITVVEIVSLFTGLFSVSLSSFFLGCVQWHKILECQQRPEPGCKQDLEDFVSCNADNKGLLNMIVAFYFTMFMIYWIARALQLVRTLRDANEMGAFYRERYGHHDDM